MLRLGQTFPMLYDCWNFRLLSSLFLGLVVSFGTSNRVCS